MNKKDQSVYIRSGECLNILKSVDASVKCFSRRVIWWGFVLNSYV